MVKLVIFFVFTLLIGCGSMPGMPGYISAATSSYDGSVQYVMEPAFVYNGESALSGSDIRMGLLWNSAMGHDGDIVLVVEFLGLMSIDTGHSLAFKIDGKESLFSPIDDYTRQSCQYSITFYRMECFDLLSFLIAQPVQIHYSSHKLPTH